MLEVATIFRIHALLETYARLIDEDRLEQWSDLFTEDARYEIISRENQEQGLPLPLLLCENRNMLQDRVTSLRNANIYNIHTNRHVLSLPRIELRDDETYEAITSFALYETSQEGVTVLYSVGFYRDLIVDVDGELRFRRKTVVVDTGAVLSLLATPI